MGLNLGAAPMGHSSLLDAEAAGSCKGREARPHSLGSRLHGGSTERIAKRPDGFVNAVAGGPAVGIGDQRLDPPVKVSPSVRACVPLVREVLVLMAGFGTHQAPLRHSTWDRRLRATFRNASYRSLSPPYA